MEPEILDQTLMTDVWCAVPSPRKPTIWCAKSQLLSGIWILGSGIDYPPNRSSQTVIILPTPQTGGRNTLSNALDAHSQAAFGLPKSLETGVINNLHLKTVIVFGNHSIIGRKAIAEGSLTGPSCPQYLRAQAKESLFRLRHI